MTAFADSFIEERLHLSRILGLLFVSFLVTLPALSLAAEASSTKIPALEAQLKNKPGDSAAAIELARLYYQKKEYAKATPFLWKHIDSLQRRDLQILLKCHAELEQSEDLLRASNLLISKNDKDYEAYHYQGRGYYLKKKENEALESFKKAITINKKYLPSYLAIGEIYEKKNNLYELRNLYSDMLKAFGPRAEILTKLCEYNARDGLNDIASDYCRKAIQKDHNIPENHIHLATALMQMDEKDKAKEVFQKTAARFKKSELVQFSYGEFLEKEKNFIDAYKAFKACLAVDSKSERCMMGLADSAFQVRKYDEAHANYHKLCRINRKYGVNVRRALVSLRTNKQKEWSEKFQSLSDFCSL